MYESDCTVLSIRTKQSIGALDPVDEAIITSRRTPHLKVSETISSTETGAVMTKTKRDALGSYRVLDLTDGHGAYCTKVLADLGADVIKVEPPDGDPFRNHPPFVHNEPEPERSLFFYYRNANKRGVTLALENSGDREAFKRLVKSADILVENFHPDHLPGLGLDYPVLREVNPALIMASITEFGRSGPYRDYRGANIVHCALSGIMISSGFAHQAPTLLPGTPAYDAASLVASVAILAALYHRGLTGQGQHIDTSVHECARLALYPWPVPFYSYGLHPGNPPPAPESRMSASIYPIFSCKDGLIRVIALTPRQWNALLRVLGRPEALMKPEWEDFLHRIFNLETLAALMQEFTAEYTMLELFEAGHREGVPIVPIFDIPGFVESPHTKARRFFVQTDLPAADKTSYPGPPYKWTETPAAVRRRAPKLGEHNDEILARVTREEEEAFDSGDAASPKERTPQPPLEGIRVISLGTGAVIPDFGMILGQLGAEVIKIESSDHLDFMRTMGGDKNAVAGFNEANRNKRSFGANLKKEKGREIVRRLICSSDIVGENFRGGVVKSLGVDYETVRAFKPDIIYISSQGFGGGGPYTDYLAYGPMLAAASGLLSLWAHPGDPYPTGSNAPFPDHMASKQAVIAVLAALDYRRRTGEGQHIDMAQTEVAANLIGEHYLDYFLNGRVPSPTGNRSPVAAPQGCYPCRGRDNWCAVSVSTDRQWERFRTALGNPAWAGEARYATRAGRMEDHDELDRRIAAWTCEREARDVMETLQAAGVPAGVVCRAEDILADPQLKWINAVIEQEHPVVGRRLYPNVPFRLPGSPCRRSTRAPLLGEHTRAICRDLLGMSEQEIDILKGEGVLEDGAP